VQGPIRAGRRPTVISNLSFPVGLPLPTYPPQIPGTNPGVSGTTSSNSKVHEVPEQPVQALQG